MKKFLAALALSLGLVFSVAAKPIYEANDGQGTKLVLHDSPCTLTEQPGFFRADLVKDGIKIHDACWAQTNDGQVFVGFDDGDVMYLPTEIFVEVKYV